MPQDRRQSNSGREDTRPSFARPPGAPPSRPADTYSPRTKRRSRVRESREIVDDEDIQHDEAYDDYDDSPAPPRRRDGATREKTKSSPAPSPQKDRSSRPGNVERTRPRDRERPRAGGHSGAAATKHKRKTSAPVYASPRGERERDRDRVKYSSGTSTGSASQLLSEDALARLNANKYGTKDDEQQKGKKRQENEKKKQYKNIQTVETAQKKRRKKNRDVSGAILEEGRGQGRVKRRGGGGGGGGRRDYDEYDEKAYIVQKNRRGKRKWNMTKRKWAVLAFLIVALIVIIAVAAAVSSKNKKGGGGGDGGSSSGSAGEIKNTCDASGVPESAKGSYTDVSTWLDTADLNCTYTDEEVGGLSVMGLFSEWDDSKSANSNTPPLNAAWDYTKIPARGVNVGGWLSIEPFITPSFFNQPASNGVVDEWTMTQKLGPAAARTLENHYATFITKQDFADIAAAGLDHVRIPFGYWAVTTYDGDPFVPKISWRYLLRAIEYCRENGLRVNLDLHGVPGSQNGWAHSGHQGAINWLAGPDGDANGQRTLDIHDQLSKFFAQDRYKNVVAMYGLVNEPYMLTLDHQKVLDWSSKAISIVRGNGITQEITFHDGFLALGDWQDMFKNVDSNLALDTHQYQIFNIPQLRLPAAEKIKVACSGWSGMMSASNNPSTGWGPTLCGEWSQADTDCAPNLNNVTAGSRWAGNLNTGTQGTSVLTPTCPSPPCSCSPANGDGSSYSNTYKQFLKMFAEAQMHAWERGRGWFYWTWKTESAPQWSWKLGRAAGILPQKAYAPDFKCDKDVPSFEGLSGGY